MTLINTTTIYNASKPELESIYQELTVEKMKLDRFFSKFLDETDLPEVDDGSLEWRTYNKKSGEYMTLVSLINTTKFYLNRHGATSI